MLLQSGLINDLTMDNDMQKTIRRIVVKIGSSLLTNNGKGLDRTAIYEWAKQIADVHQQGIEVVLVSSGAIAEGVVRMGLSERPKKLPALQACASIGQMGLIETWWQALIQRGVQSSQILLTHDDLSHRSRYLNISQTISQLISWRVVPVINENDSISYGEIKFGDNDTLGAMAATILSADLYIILTDQMGLFTDNPNKNPDASLIKHENAMADYLFDIAGDGGKWGSGGMLTKVRAARLAAMANCPTIIASGKVENVITRLVAGETIGTYLATKESDKLIAKKQWLAAHIRTSGTLVIDEGAKLAITDNGRSLLPVGVVDVHGDFEAGDVVEIISKDNIKVAVGQVAFCANDAKKIIKQHTQEVLDTLQLTDDNKAIMVHRDDMAVL